MCLDNFRILGKNDTVKFVVGCHDDLIKTKKIIDDYRLNGKCNLYISPVFGRIKLEDIVDFMNLPREHQDELAKYCRWQPIPVPRMKNEGETP